jgi:hypothetical protein
VAAAVVVVQDREKLRMLHTYRADLDSANSKRSFSFSFF